MARRKSNRILPLVLVLIAIAIAIAVLISLARAVFLPSENNDNQSTGQTQTQALDPTAALIDASADRSVSLVASGPIVANENFRSYQILVSPSSRKLILYEGYLGRVVDSIDLDTKIFAPIYKESDKIKNYLFQYKKTG